MRSLLLIGFVLLSHSGLTQDLDCTGFKNGTFITTAELPDILKEEFGENLQLKIVREGTLQTEEAINVSQAIIDSGYPVGIKQARVEWVDSCSYRLFKVKGKGETKQTDEFINQQGGVLVQITRIEGNCYYYESSVDGIDLIVPGKMCKTE